MRLRNLAVVFCAASALLAACSTDDDPGVNGGGVKWTRSSGPEARWLKL